VIFNLLVVNNYYTKVADIQNVFIYDHPEEDFLLKEPKGYDFIGEEKF
jgi:hypothetical protein